MMQALREDISARELERKISDLKRDRVRIEDTIRRMESTQQRIFREDSARGRVSAAEEEKADTEQAAEKNSEDKKKRRRDRSGSGSDSEEASNPDEDTKDDKEKEDKEVEKEKTENGEEDPEDKEKEDKTEAKDGEKKRRAEDTRPKKSDPRSRNLFGKLLGHLHSAKSRLENEKGSKAAELNAKAQERINEKLSLSKMNIREFRKEQFDNRKKEEEEKVGQIEKTIEEMELLLLQKRLEGHYSLMMNFIRTKAEPTIFYLPAKHTKDTEHALEETRAAIKHKTASLKVQLQPPQPGDEEAAAIRASAAAAAVEAAINGGEAKDKEGKEAKTNGEDVEDKDKPEEEKKAEPSDEEDKKEAADSDDAASSEAKRKKRRSNSADGRADEEAKSPKRRKEDGSASESGR